MNEIISLGLVSVVVSGLVQYLKNRFGTTSIGTISIVAGLSLISGLAYFFLQGTVIWQGFLQVLVISNAIYGFIIKHFEA